MPSPSDAFDRRNLLTYVSLFCGLVAIAAAGGGHAHLAGFAVALGVIADTFDGRFARLFGSDPGKRALGVQLDSLADAIAFGIAPPLCAALLLNAGTDAAGVTLWGAAFTHAACSITRLASYNVSAIEPGSTPASLGAPKPRSGEGGFIGIPVPLAALIWATAVLVQPAAAVTIGVILATAAAMVLPIRIPRPTGAGLVLFTCWPVAVAILHATL
jgi:CDP-diacylglycerol--serine O-phosphatidyltransferase